ncbi:MAG: GntR family transcriptional regulator [Lachnospiraceae bacterium]|nr:GntR family transcriptional regulator [Lachnospiraceae bacterium]
MENKSAYAYETIKEMILNGTLPPLSDVSEKKLQEQLQCSRTPVHEAIKQLESENLVITYPRKGTFITDVTIEMVRDLYETRLLLEPSITRQAVSSASKEWLLDLRSRLQVEHAMETHEDILAVMALDTELHTGIAALCDNLYLRNTLRVVYEHDRRIRLKTERNVDQVRFSQKEHVRILDAMIDGDADKTEALSREHVEHSRDLTFESLGFRNNNFYTKTTL